MKIPDVRQIGVATIEGRRFLVFMIAEDWEPDNDHDVDHARGGCECPCDSPLDALREAAQA